MIFDRMIDTQRAFEQAHQIIQGNINNDEHPRENISQEFVNLILTNEFQKSIKSSFRALSKLKKLECLWTDILPLNNFFISRN